MLVGFVKKHFTTFLYKERQDDRYGILSPLLATSDYLHAAADLTGTIKDSPVLEVLRGKTKPSHKYTEMALKAYQDFVKDLRPEFESNEKKQPFSVISLILDSIIGNIQQIEDNYQGLFGEVGEQTPEQCLRSSSLLVLGYLEKSDQFATWLSSLIEHLTASESDLIPPFRTKEMIKYSEELASFANDNLHRWNPRSDGLLSEINEMQRRGSDVVIQSADGEWIDEFAHDSQFSPMEDTLITASLRSPILWIRTRGYVKAQDKIDLLNSRKEWLTSKLIFEQSKLRGLAEGTPEYKRLQAAVHFYADAVSRYEQKLERMRQL